MDKLTGNPNLHHASSFTTGLKGNCLCGSIHVTIDDSELFKRRRGHICHCANCRKVSGSYASINLIIEENKVQIEDHDGTLREYVDKETMSGNPVGRWFCSRCGNCMLTKSFSPIKSVTPTRPGVVIVKMGIFPRIPAPEFETFVLHRHEWQGQHENTIQFKIRLGDERV
ncbi:hypothetical protein N431DRAFT_559984 [Stipitochalara longipes BDJ]|nr:hypothetical protein N431DRAFT_559984 [Stipitochalara longipes BDJ]